MGILDADKIRSAGRATKTINIPEWGGEVVLREFTIDQVEEVAQVAGDNGEDTVDSKRLILKYGVAQPVLDDKTLDHILGKGDNPDDAGGVGAATRLLSAITDWQVELQAGTTQEEREATF